MDAALREVILQRFHRVTVVGAGVIGASWVAVFLAHGGHMTLVAAPGSSMEGPPPGLWPRNRVPPGGQAASSGLTSGPEIV